MLCYRERTKTNFFSMMRKRLQLCNPVKYSDRVCLDNDLRVLSAACKNKVPKDDNVDLEEIIESHRKQSSNKSSTLKVVSGLDNDRGLGK
jgi:hypothetical protein